MEDMLHHCQAVARGCKRPLLVADLPFGSYESGEQLAMLNAARLIKEGNMDCVKMEGGADRAHLLRAVVRGGVAVMGHVGLTPQSFSALGGFKAQGRTAAQVRCID
jgi:3-methyl-2-oxobutanoate hydroxymethyltransferase